MPLFNCNTEGTQALLQGYGDIECSTSMFKMTVFEPFPQTPKYYYYSMQTLEAKTKMVNADNACQWKLSSDSPKRASQEIFTTNTSLPHHLSDEF